MVAAGNASYAGMVFGLFKVLGCTFSPRFRDLGDQRFWHASMPGGWCHGKRGTIHRAYRDGMEDRSSPTSPHRCGFRMDLSVSERVVVRKAVRTPW
ncbi:hypothetical protein GCM10010140_61560 [Streptosporangium pseudovulgare]|uniref:Tn3 transposase DDE domain-containing protein n=2 Tax=Streptosporangium pseudovulgare TaxID=35765 RepID=A0ABQ2REP2_9ACTN|nr:hypothetical protein GCM10010140_61560 [Streptosporangium pseudovulgare]